MINDVDDSAHDFQLFEIFNFDSCRSKQSKQRNKKICNNKE